MPDFSNHKPNNRLYEDRLRQKRNLAIAFIVGYVITAAVVVIIMRSI